MPNIVTRMINFYLIRSKERTYLKDSVRSFYDTVPKDINLKIIEEKRTREETLNSIFEMNNNKSMVCFSDDIILTEGWYQIILKNLFGVRAIGFSMKNPVSGQILNYGFDLVDDNGYIKTLARTNWVDDTECDSGFSRCASFTGCFFSLSSECFDLVPGVPLDGLNRLGELLYHVLLTRAGGNVLVSSHVLGHYSVSTKSKLGDPTNSQSFQDEKVIWDNAITKYKLCTAVSLFLGASFSPLPSGLSGELVVWGAGSVAEKIINKFNLDVSFFISGLIEEDGRSFMEREIFFYKSLKDKNINNILITVANLEKPILEIIKEFLNVKNIFFVQIRQENDFRHYSIEKI